MKFRALAYIILFPIMLFGQHFSLGGEVGMGRLFRHSTNFSFESPELTYLGEIHFNWQSNPTQVWAKNYNFPTIQMILRYQTHGNMDVLGQSISFYPAINIPLSKKRRLHLFVGSGISFVTQNYIENRENNAIGSYLNNISRFKLLYYFRQVKNWKPYIAVDFTHISNGRAKSPNLGLNTYHLIFGVQRQDFKASFYESKQDFSWKKKRWFIDLGSHYSIRDDETIGGPRYPNYGLHLALGWAISPIQRLHLGLDWEHNQETAEDLIVQLTVNSREKAQQLAKRWGLFVADEFMFGSFSVGALLGFYIKANEVTRNIYNKLFFRYYPFMKKLKGGPYVGITLKSHRVVAEYIGINLGYRY